MKNATRRLLTALLGLALSAAMTLSMAACSKDDDKKADDTTPSVSDSADSGEASGAKEMGEGAKTFAFNVTDSTGAVTEFTIHTDEETVGAALLKVGLIAGDDSEYGLYVKTVNGITADYDTDGSYWAFYIDGEYAQTGVDSTDIKAGATYTLKIEVTEG